MNCPKCNKPMIKRNRKSDGKQFWGCSGFPKCRQIVNIGEEKVNNKFGPAGSSQPPKLPTPDKRFQQPILTKFLSEKRNLMVKACAGSGKTTLLKMLAYELPKDVSISYVVFNAKIRDEAQETLPYWVNVMTSHQLGFSAIRQHVDGRVQVEQDKVTGIVKKIVRSKWDEEKWMIAPVCNLVGKLKNTLAPSDDITLTKIAARFNIDLDDSSSRIFELVRQVMVENNRQVNIIDFDDMLYLPWKFKMSVQKFDILLTDEVQDFNQAQLHLLQAACHKETQVIGVGDSDQAMYGFRGADLEAMKRMGEFFEAETMPLSITYRVPKSGVELVNKLFPEIEFEAAAWAKEGVVRQAREEEALSELITELV